MLGSVTGVAAFVEAVLLIQPRYANRPNRMTATAMTIATGIRVDPASFNSLLNCCSVTKRREYQLDVGT